MNNIVFNKNNDHKITSKALQKIMTPQALAEIMREGQKHGTQFVFTNGCFDLLHLGHVRYLQEARELGDYLILGLNSDESVRYLKGAGRPLVSEGERAEIMANLLCVDFVTVFSEHTAVSLVELLRPDIYVKGSDYAGEQPGVPDTGRLPEAQAVQSYGGVVRLIPYLPHHSTTELIAKIKKLP
ncbi:MAG TPA: adenylyltransferase/cytidyltransferase family protein [Ktedonobacteraceae bacterium]|jgi:D-beta-D-heptose 7-phosphate kinase/D-beta-D-heptose 1-phosphate adenosyltransferase